MEASKVVVVVINYNSDDYLRSCMDSILNQTYENIDVIFIDNHSTDKEGLDFMHKEYDDDPRVTIIANTVNKGYAKAANQGIRMAISRDAEFVSITNPDIVYSPKYFDQVIPRIKKDEDIAAITGKVYKYDFTNMKPTDIIDTVGLFAYRNRRIIDEGQGMIDEGQFNKEKEVFGVSGACPVYRIDALEATKVLDEYFDEDFFMYKEDVDLGWRFLLYGWKNLFYPKALAYHGRGTGAIPRFTPSEIIKGRKLLNKIQKKYAFRNQLLMTRKNELWGNFFKDFFPLMVRKIITPFYALFFEPFLIKSYFQYLKLIPRMFKKRRIIMHQKKATSKDMQKWFQKESGHINK